MKRLSFIALILGLTLGTTYADETPTLVSTEVQNRKILIEEFTGIGCSNCPRAHKTSNKIVADNPGNAFVMNIHQGPYATGKNPDLTTEWGNALYNMIEAGNMYPNGTINRHVFDEETGKLAIFDTKWAATAPKVLEMPSYVNVGAKATIDWAQRKIMVDVEVYYTEVPGTGITSNFLNVALLQDHIAGDQVGMSNNPAQMLNGKYDHLHALRDLLTGQWGEELTEITKGKLIKKTYSKVLPTDIKNVDVLLEDLSVLVYVTETKEREVMNVCEAEITHVGAPKHIVRLLETGEATYTTCGAEGKVRLRVADILSGEKMSEYTIEVTTPSGNKDFVFTPTDLAVGQDEWVEVGPFPIVLNEHGTVTLRLKKVNGEAYLWEDRHQIAANVVKWGGECSATNTPMTLNLMQDQFGQDITWELTKDGIVLQNGGPYRELSEPGTRLNAVTLTSTTEDGCYVLTVKDASNDGINNKYGEGYIEVKDKAGAVIAKMDGKYDSLVRIFLSVSSAGVKADVAVAYELMVSPNPVPAGEAAVLTVYAAKAEKLNVTVFNAAGVRMGESLRVNATVGSNRFELPSMAWPSGIYMILVNGEDGRRTTCKVVIR